jgi:hypothetical protein
MVKNPLSVLWIGKCTIYEYQDVTDPETYQTTQQLIPTVVDEPCRLSQNYVSHTPDDLVKVGNGVPNVAQLIVLFIRPDLVIKAGSVIEVTQRGITNKYKRSSIPAVYSNHQEIVLELHKDYA